MDHPSENIDIKQLSKDKTSEKSTPCKKDIVQIGWREIGLHRSIASFWYQFVLLLLIAAPAIIMYGFVLPNYILPYPEAMGYNSLTTTYFALFFSIMNVATQPACERFVAQYAEINPKKAIKYVSFFIYFQMFTGLIQITAITFFCFTYIVHTSLAYAMWFFLLYSTTQFPGMLGAYNSALKGYQRFDRSNIVDLIQGVIFENFTQVVFILIGRWWGSLDPAVGELMGATMGFIIGKYLDDFIAMMLSVWFLGKILKPYNIKVRETLIPSFGKEEIKDSLIYGVKLLGATIISDATEYITLVMVIAWLPNYITILGYISLAKTIADVVGLRYNFSSLMSEAYNNGKKKLTQYVISRYIQHWWYLSFFLSLTISILAPKVLTFFGGEWGKAAWIIPIYVLPRLMVAPPCMGADILQACDKPMYRTYGIVSEKVTKMITVFLFLSPYGLLRILGQGAVIYLYILHDIPAYIVITITEFWFVHKKITPLKVNWWQTFGAGTLCIIPILPIDYALLGIIEYLYYTSETLVIPLIFTGISFISMLFLIPMLLFFFYGLLGGLDDISLEEFKKAAVLSGPSRFIITAFVRFAEKGHKISPLKNRFATPHKEAYKEIDELMAMVVCKE